MKNVAWENQRRKWTSYGRIWCCNGSGGSSSSSKKNVQIFFIFSLGDMHHLSTVQLVLAAISHAQVYNVQCAVCTHSRYDDFCEWLTAFTAQVLFVHFFTLLVCANVHLHLFRLEFKKNRKETKNARNTWWCSSYGQQRRGQSLIRQQWISILDFDAMQKRCQRTIHLPTFKHLLAIYGHANGKWH